MKNRIKLVCSAVCFIVFSCSTHEKRNVGDGSREIMYNSNFYILDTSSFEGVLAFYTPWVEDIEYFNSKPHEGSYATPLLIEYDSSVRKDCSVDCEALNYKYSKFSNRATVMNPLSYYELITLGNMEKYDFLFDTTIHKIYERYSEQSFKPLFQIPPGRNVVLVDEMMPLMVRHSVKLEVIRVFAINEFGEYNLYNVPFFENDTIRDFFPQNWYDLSK